MTAIVERVAELHRGELLRAAMAVARNRDDAEDAVQQALATGVRLNGSLRAETAVHYLATCARHEALALARARSRYIGGEDAESVLDYTPDPAASAGFEALENEEDPRVRPVRAALATLTPDERIALREFYAEDSRWGDGRYHRIARRHGWTYTKVNRLLTEGRQALRDALAGPLVLTVYVDRERFPTQRLAIAEAMRQRRGRIVMVAKRKLRHGQECSTRGRARADGYLGEPVWRVDVEVTL